jgi:hypothetical protein
VFTTRYALNPYIKQIRFVFKGLIFPDILFYISDLIQVSALGWSLVQRSPTECGVSECDREASIMMRPWPTGGCCAIRKKNLTWRVCVCVCARACVRACVACPLHLIRFRLSTAVMYSDEDKSCRLSLSSVLQPSIASALWDVETHSQKRAVS